MRNGPSENSVRARAEQVRRAELDRMQGRWDDLRDADRRRLEALTTAIVSRLLDDSVPALEEPLGSEVRRP
jgi:glutamyl-tRNA reductase